MIAAGLYQLTPLTAGRAAAGAELAPSGSEGFDLGPAGLDRVSTDQSSYPSLTDPVQARVELTVRQAGPAHRLACWCLAATALENLANNHLIDRFGGNLRAAKQVSHDLTGKLWSRYIA